MAAGSYWTAATSKFDGDTYFCGGDGGASVDLGSTRVLWLFGDTFVRTTGGQARSASKAIRNSVAIQSVSYDLSAATMTYYCGGGGMGSAIPASFFPERSVGGASVWTWPGCGVMVDTVLLLAMPRMEPSTSTFGFSNAGWDLVLVDNPSAAPSSWSVNYLPTPSFFSLSYFYSLHDPGDGWVYGTVVDRDLGLRSVRFDRALAKSGDVMSPQTWCGGMGWLPAGPAQRARRAALYSSSSTEGTLVSRASDFALVETPGFGGTNQLAYSLSSSRTGPFPALSNFYEPYGSDPNLSLASSNYLVYGGKAHPEQTWSGKTASDVLCTYATNATGGHSVLTDETIYYVRPVKATGLT